MIHYICIHLYEKLLKTIFIWKNYLYEKKLYEKSFIVFSCIVFNFDTYESNIFQIFLQPAVLQRRTLSCSCTMFFSLALLLRTDWFSIWIVCKNILFFISHWIYWANIFVSQQYLGLSESYFYALLYILQPNFYKWIQ